MLQNTTECVFINIMILFFINIELKKLVYIKLYKQLIILNYIFSH